MLLLLIGILLCAATVALVARAVVLPRLRTEASLQHIGKYGYPRHDLGGSRAAPLSEALDRLAERVGTALLPRVHGSDGDEVRALLVTAGAWGTTPGRFLGYRVLSTIGLAGFWLWFGSSAGLPTALFALTVPVIAICGWMVPLSLLRTRSERRLERIDAGLPDLIDSLVVTIEAGVGFGGALRMASRETPGPLGEEIQLMLREQAMGLDGAAALESMLRRANTAAMGSFVRSVNQGETLGVSIGEIMRGLSEEMRDRRRAKAEARAQRAPVKMLFPLAFCIFPAILIVLVYPAVSEFSRALGG